MEQATGKTILLIGRPGSGKGTQAKLLAEKLDAKIFSSGDTFREIRNSVGALGDRVREGYDKGQLQPNWFADYLFMKGVLDLPHEQSVVLEGFGRSKPQAELMCEIFGWIGRDLRVVHLKVSEEETLRRMLERAKTDNRPDSNDEAKVRARFAEYETNTAPALEFFRSKGIVDELDGELSIEEIHANILSCINA